MFVRHASGLSGHGVRDGCPLRFKSLVSRRLQALDPLGAEGNSRTDGDRATAAALIEQFA
jgi:hypothetical protein